MDTVNYGVYPELQTPKTVHYLYPPPRFTLLLPLQALTDKADKGKGKVGGKRDRPDDPPSFFSWFEDNSMGGDEVGEVIKDDIWANPMQYYLVSL